jgi:hypothetical protein
MTRLVALACLFALACGNPSDGEVELVANAGVALRGFVGETVRLDGSASEGAVSFVWNAGNGAESAPSESPIFDVVYQATGRYQAVLTAYDDEGRRRTAAVAVTIVKRPVFAPSSSGPLVRAGATLAVIEPDADRLSLFEIADDGALTLQARLETCRSPRSVTPFEARYAVSCELDDAVELHSSEGGAPVRIDTGRGTRPFGTASHGDRLAVSLSGTGELLVIAPDDGGGFAITERVFAVTDARAVASLPDGRFVVSRWRSTRGFAELAVVDAATAEVTLVTLAVDPQPSSDTETGGVLNYLESLSVSPAGDELLVAGLHANVIEGAHRTGRALAFDRTVRAVIATVDLETLEERFERRRQFDSRGFASAVRHTSYGDFAFATMRGARTVERVDQLNRAQSGTIMDVGYAPDGLALSSDDGLLFVHASLSRSVEVFDVRDFRAAPARLGNYPTVDAEPLDPVVFRGKQLFNDSADPRLGRDGYMACAHCHLDGRSDLQVWDFTDRGEGLRRTISLEGRGGEAPLHWSANFDEVQDFEHDIRQQFGGTGLLGDALFFTGGRDHPLGAPKAGLGADLDALAAYVESLTAYPKSPYRDEGGSLTPEAALGKAIFDDPGVGCVSCHEGPALAKSEFVEPGVPLLFDVGTLGPGSGARLGEPLTGLDTPGLHGLFDGGPYLHDGSAETLHIIFTAKNPDDAHGVTSTFDEASIDALVAYLLSLDGAAD